MPLIIDDKGRALLGLTYCSFFAGGRRKYSSGESHLCRISDDRYTRRLDIVRTNQGSISHAVLSPTLR